MTCFIAASDAPARYAAGALDASEAREFEDHLLECAECQAAVREAARLRFALRSLPAEARAEPSGWRRRWAPSLAYATVAAAAVAVLAVVWPRDAVRRLGGVDSAPGFQGLAVRADADATATLADRGMAAYVDGDYAAASRLLGDAAREADAPPAVHFFLGVALLMEGDAAGAASALERALRTDGDPYAPEARLYLAKARLRLGDAEGALDELRRVPPGSSVLPWAGALADSVGRAMR